MARKKDTPTEIHYCYECAHAYDWHNLSVKGVPTLAHCPYEEYCVIRSQRACKEHFKPKKP